MRVGLDSCELPDINLWSGGNCYTAGNSVHESRAVRQRAKHWRGIATRYEKRAVNYRAMVIWF
jgi:hypothetical protein